MFRKIYFVLLMLMVGIVADAQLYMVVQMKDHTYKSYEVNDKLKVTWEVDSNSLTTNSPEGTVGMLNGREAIVFDFGSKAGKKAMAIQNVGATDTQKLGNTYTWWEVQDLSFNDNWYLLDAYKMNAMLNTATQIDDLSDYNLMTLWFNGSRLDFPMTTKITGDYWTSTGDDDVNAISVCFAGGIGPNIFNRSIGKGESFPIRLCHDL